MFTLAKIRDGSTYFASHLSANDYYSKGERVIGTWIGRAASKLGLAGEVTPDQFEALRANRHPETGQRLTARTASSRRPTRKEAAVSFQRQHGRTGSLEEVERHRNAMPPTDGRVAFFDFQCGAHKSISLMAVLAGDRRLREAHHRASNTAIAELERFASRQANTPLERVTQFTGNLCAAAFTHDASRALDPQLHTHYVVANATQAPNGKWYALDEFHLLHAIRYAGKVYQNELARAVLDLGYDIEDVREKGRIAGFKIAGVPDKLCERFAKRRRVIEAEIDRFKKTHGREPSTKEIALITRQTRQPERLREIATPEVRALQLEQLTGAERRNLFDLRARAEQRPPRLQPVPAERHAIDAALESLFERASVQETKDILAEALNHNLGNLALPELRRQLATHEQIVHLAPGDADGLKAPSCTKRGLELEQWSVAYVDSTKGKCPALNEAFVTGPGLSDEQREAVEYLLRSRDRVMAFRGAAGAGKTKALSELAQGLSHCQVIALAPTASAVDVLRKEGFPFADTVAGFLLKAERSQDFAGSVLICDEAGLQSNQQGADLLRLAQRDDIRVIFVGDTRQHVSVEAGDFLRILEAHSSIARCELLSVRRQQPPAYRTAIQQMAAGSVRAGMQSLDQLGWISEDGPQYIGQAASRFLALSRGGSRLEDCLAVAPTWEENFLLTQTIRDGLKQTGTLQPGAPMTVHHSLGWTNSQKRQARAYEPGMVVAFTQGASGFEAGQFATVAKVHRGKVILRHAAARETVLNLKAPRTFDVAQPRAIDVSIGDRLLIRANDKASGLINGKLLTVAKIHADGIATNEGVTIPRRFRAWCHGYVTTSHKSQGMTCRHVVVAAERLDAKAAYVACSRGMQTCSVHTPDKSELLARLPEGNRLAALDVLQRSGPKPAVANRGAQWLAHFGQRFVRQATAIGRHATDTLRRIMANWRTLRSRTQPRHKSPGQGHQI
jgi:conjugative relaxase-like TrwC/TraI family protein